jgi:hypothetical protein
LLTNYADKLRKRICRLVGVTEVCAHPMRGLHSTLAFERGTIGALVAESLRHTNGAIITSNYAKPAAVKKGTSVLAGGRNTSSEGHGPTYRDVSRIRRRARQRGHPSCRHCDDIELQPFGTNCDTR